jgi:hypothetical protein
VTSCTFAGRYQCFIGTCCLLLHGKRINHAENKLTQEWLNGSNVNLIGSCGHKDSWICGKEEARIKMEAASSFLKHQCPLYHGGLYSITYLKTVTSTSTDTRASAGIYMIN